MKHLLDLTLDEFSDICIDAGRPSYLAKQVFSWIYGKKVVDFQSMTNVSKADRQWLESNYRVFRSRLLKTR